MFLLLLANPNNMGEEEIKDSTAAGENTESEESKTAESTEGAEQAPSVEATPEGEEEGSAE